MLTCPVCDTRLPDEARFCSHCGTAQTPAAGKPSPNPSSSNTSGFLSSSNMESVAGHSDYTPAHLQNSVFSGGAEAVGEHKQVTVLFVDIKRSLDLSRAVGAEAWHEILNQFFAVLTRAVHSYDGTINQYTGDGVMALFGAPLSLEDHAQRACMAALRIQSELANFAERLKGELGVDLIARFGINSGEVVVGRIGDDLRRDYTAQGETVAIAARIEGLARDGAIYVSEATVELVEGLFKWRDRGDFRLQHSNRQDSLRVYELRKADGYRRRFDVMRERGLGEIIGRDHELWQLKARLDTLSGEVGDIAIGAGEVGCMIGISAATGMGKSRLSYEATRLARQRDITVLELRGGSDYQVAPLRPYEELFRALLGLTVSDSPRLARRKISYGLNHLLGAQAIDDVAISTHWLTGLLGYRVLPANSDAATEDQAARLNLLLSLLIRRSLRRRPTLLLLDNLHWLEQREGAANLLEQLAKIIGDSRLMVVATYRDDYAVSWANWAHCQQFDLGPLDTDQMARLIGQQLKTDAPQTVLAHALQAHTGGSPLFMEELLRQLLADDKLEKLGGQYQLKSQGGALQLPPSVQAVISSRVDGLHDVDKQALQAAAVIGKEFSVSVLASALQLTEQVVVVVLEGLERSNFIYRLSELPALRYTFHQSLVRSVIYDALLSEQRSVLHGRIADAMRGNASGDCLAMVADHYERAGQSWPAAIWWDKAAQWAVDSDPAAAVAEWKKSLHWLEALTVSSTAGDEHQPDLYRLQLTVIMRLVIHISRANVDREELAGYISKGNELVAARGDAITEAYFASAIAVSELFSGDLSVGRLRYEDVLSLSQAEEDTELEVMAHVGIALAALNLGDLNTSRNHAELGLSVADGDTDLGARLMGRSPLVSLILLRGWVTLEEGDINAAEALFREALPLAAARNEREHHLLLRLLLIKVACERGDLDTVVDDFERVSQAVNESGNTLLVVAAGRVSAAVQLAVGEWEKAIHAIKQASQTLKDRGTPLIELAPLEVCLAHATLGAGEPKQARLLAQKAIQSSRARHMRVVEADAQLIWAASSLAGRQANRHLRRINDCLDQAEAIIESTGAHLLSLRLHLLRAECEALQGNKIARLSYLKQAADRLHAIGDLRRANMVEEQMAELAG